MKGPPRPALIRAGAKFRELGDRHCWKKRDHGSRRSSHVLQARLGRRRGNRFPIHRRVPPTRTATLLRILAAAAVRRHRRGAAIHPPDRRSDDHAEAKRQGDQRSANFCGKQRFHHGFRLSHCAGCSIWIPPGHRGNGIALEGEQVPQSKTSIPPSSGETPQTGSPQAVCPLRKIRLI